MVRSYSSFDLDIRANRPLDPVALRVVFLKCVRDLLRAKEFKRWCGSHGKRHHSSIVSTKYKLDAPNSSSWAATYVNNVIGEKKMHTTDVVQVQKAVAGVLEMLESGEQLDSDEMSELFNSLHLQLSVKDLKKLHDDIQAIGNYERKSISKLFVKTTSDIITAAANAPKKSASNRASPLGFHQYSSATSTFNNRTGASLLQSDASNAAAASLKDSASKDRQTVISVPADLSAPGSLVALTVRRRHLLSCVMGTAQDRVKLQLQEAMPNKWDSLTKTTGATSLALTEAKAKEILMERRRAKFVVKSRSPQVWETR